MSDDEKKATTNIEYAVVGKTKIYSRYHKIDEIELMSAAVRAMPVYLRTICSLIYCNSKHTHDYTITMRSPRRRGFRKEEKEEIAHWLSNWMVTNSPDQGHNGIAVNGRGETYYVDPRWSVDEPSDAEATP